MSQGLPLPYQVQDPEVQGNFDELKKHFPISRKDVKLEDPHVVGDSGEPAFQNSWVNYDTATFQGARFWKDAFDIVHLEGLVKNGTGPPSTIFTLPAGYRPANGILFSTLSNSAVGRIDVAATGNVTFQLGSNVWISLNGLSFRRAN